MLPNVNYGFRHGAEHEQGVREPENPALPTGHPVHPGTVGLAQEDPDTVALQAAQAAQAAHQGQVFRQRLGRPQPLIRKGIPVAPIPKEELFADPQAMQPSRWWSDVLRSITDPGKFWAPVDPGDPPRCKEEIPESIHNELFSGGLGHVVWGSKPAQYLEDGYQGGIWFLLKHCAQLMGHDIEPGKPCQIAPGMWLIQGARKNDYGEYLDTPLEPLHEHGFLVNERNVLRTIAEEPERFLKKSRFNIAANNREIWEDYARPTLINMQQSEFDMHAGFAGMMFGFDPEDAELYQRLKSTPENDPVLLSRNEHIDRQLEQAYAAKEDEADFPMPHIPPYFKTRIGNRVARYFGESVAMQSGFKRAWEDAGRTWDGAYEDHLMTASAFLSAIFGAPEERGA
jgi:hypothetical protein